MPTSLEQEETVCPECLGSGTVEPGDTDETECSHCFGTGLNPDIE